jgi:CBS domain-containing protein
MAPTNASSPDVARITWSSISAFLVLVASYVGLLYAIKTLGSGSQPPEWMALIVVLALGAATGVGASWAVLKLIGSGDFLQKLSKLSVSNVLSGPPAAEPAPPYITAQDLAEAPQHWDNGIVPVAGQDGKLQGIVTKEDLCRQPASASLSEIMTRQPVVAHPDSNLAEVYQLMQRTEHHRIPIVTRDDGKYVGMITSQQILQSLTK